MIDLLLKSPEPRLYMANPGNLGDALIREGTIAYFKEINLSYEEVRKPPRDKIGTFIYGGGGAWCKNWNNSRYVSAAVDNARKIIVLPSTYAIHSPLYKIRKISFFCRDKKDSLLYCKKAKYHQDMAFHLWGSIGPIQAGIGVGYFMRTDKESAKLFKIPRDNRDISIQGKTYSDTQGFIASINKYREIHTDRLHVAIVACMLGKKIYFYEGNYWKNRAIYQTKMEGTFDVTFREYDRS